MTATHAAGGAGDPGVMALERLVVMANQIGAFFAPYPPERRAEGIRNHLRTYWDPRMRAELLAHIARGGDDLDPRVIEGARLLELPDHEQRGYYGPPKA
jgi:formate dehydrogenase subunit delta